MSVFIRPLARLDIAGVVELSLHAWGPIFASFREVLGEDIYGRVYPDWRRAQARDVARVCDDLADTTWVAEDPGHAPARRAYEKAGFMALPLVRYYRAL